MLEMVVIIVLGTFVRIVVSEMVAGFIPLKTVGRFMQRPWPVLDHRLSQAFRNIGDFEAGVGQCGSGGEQGNGGRTAKWKIFNAGISEIGWSVPFDGRD